MLDHTRHLGIFNVSHLKVCLIGAGGIGALTAITLGKMGIEDIWVIDDDWVDEVNIATQFYRLSDVRNTKGRSTLRNLYEFSGVEGKALMERVRRGFELPEADITITTVDSIASRQDIWDCLIKSYKTERQAWYLDARMGAEVFELFIVDLWEPLWYEEHITHARDEDIPDLPCTSKATIYTSDIASGHIGAAVRRIATLEQSPGFLRHDIFKNELSFLEMK